MENDRRRQQAIDEVMLEMVNNQPYPMESRSQTT
jgi:hypothetical protein